ncbi:hypothetical protein OUZ56_015795 [Daphnia magna]|uniref:Uncharacterized protein n=1 Tax=Daphnia magna TaxID=35525 RepID=A0ABR0ANR9_9CRUS|nr:hypothetical protein OUZ56_015795 [Daphnia magna]
MHPSPATVFLSRLSTTFSKIILHPASTVLFQFPRLIRVNHSYSVFSLRSAAESFPIVCGTFRHLKGELNTGHRVQKVAI